MESNANVNLNEVFEESQGKDEHGKKKASKLENFIVASVCLGTTGIIGVLASWLSYRTENKKHSELIKKLKKYPNKSVSNRISEGRALAFKALRQATLYAVLGSSIVAFIFWKISTSKTVKDYFAKKQKSIPSSPDERTDFESLGDFFNYVYEKYQEEKEAKKNVKSI